jgi:tetratricopeptide (TPR) repeat protein
MAQAEAHRLREYLLGQLPEAEEEQVELRLLTEPEFAEEYDIVVNEITDDYIAGNFEGAELRQVEEHFFKSSDRRDKLNFALALRQQKTDLSKDAKERRKGWLNPYLAIAASVLLVVGGFYIWRVSTNNAELNQGLAALQSAFRDERPLDARLSDFNYAPFPNLRGSPGNEKIDQNELNRAELTLLDALRKNPTPAVHHGLGKVFLAKKEFDRAIKEFDEALKSDPKNAQLYSDLGAAWLEKGKVDVDKGKADPSSPLAGEGMEELGRALENLNQALGSNPNLLEALFNRALCKQRLSLYKQAEADWRDYLKKDSGSPWAEEARRNLQTLTDSNKSAVDRANELFAAFLQSYQDRDAAGAWQALRQSRSRSGNQVIERLADDYLNAVDRSDKLGAPGMLHMLVFAGEVESQQVGDQYTSELARFYSQANRDQCARLRAARALADSAHQQYDKSEFESAIAIYNKAVAAFRKEGDTCEALANESWIGYCELRLANSKSGERFGLLAAQYSNRRYKTLLAQALHAQSDAETTSNEFSKVLNLAGAALREAEAIQDDATKQRCLQQFVSINRQYGNYSDSLKFGLLALSASSASALDPKLSWTFYHELALDFYWLRMPGAALQFEEEALRQAQQANWPFIIVRSYTQLGIILEQQANYPAAIQNGRLAVSEGEKIDGRKARLNVVSHAVMRLGHLYRQSGDFSNAIASYDQALAMFAELKLGMFLYEAHKGKFMALAAAGQTSAATVELAETVQLFEQYRPKIQEEKGRNSFFDIGQDTYDLAIDFVHTHPARRQASFHLRTAYSTSCTCAGRAC